MYNYQAHLLSQKRQQQQISRHNSALKESVRHTRANQSLLSKHQDRLQKIIKQTSQSGVIVKRSLDPIVNINRSFDKSKNLGLEMLVTCDRSEKERIDRSVIENSIRDIEPQRKSPTRHQFRERRRSREIQPEMRFTPHMPMERVVESISRGNLYELDPAQEKESLKTQKQILNRSAMMTQAMKKTFLSNEFSRHIFDNLHKRTYFKTLEQTALGAPGLNKYFLSSKKNGINSEIYTPRSNRNVTEGKVDKTEQLQKLSKEILLKSKFILDHSVRSSREHRQPK